MAQALIALGGLHSRNVLYIVVEDLDDIAGSWNKHYV